MILFLFVVDFIGFVGFVEFVDFVVGFLEDSLDLLVHWAVVEYSRR